MGAISRSLKILAKELNVPVVVLSQLSRAPEARSDGKPQLSDLRESGALEQDADVVVLIYREDVYKPTEENDGVAQLIVASRGTARPGNGEGRLREGVHTIRGLGLAATSAVVSRSASAGP